MSREPGGDDLDDGLDYSYDMSADEAVSEEQLLEAASDSETEDIEVPQPQEPERPTKRKKSEKSDKLANKKRAKVETMAEQRKQVALYPPDMIANYVSSKIRQKNADLSSIEVDEQTLGKSLWVDTTDFKKDRTDGNYAEFITQKFKKVLDGEKFVFVLCMSAIRACDVMRELKSLGCLKLIKKNKLAYDKKALTVGKTFLAASTAGRIKKLADDGILDLSRVGALVLDTTHLDDKSHSIWDIEGVIPALKHITDGSSAKLYMY